MKNFVVLLILIAASFCAVSGQDGTNGDFIAPVRNAPVNIPKFDISPVIDGKLDDAIWKKAAVFDNFVQIQPGDNIAPSKETKAYVGYDEKFLYVGFHAFDDPGLVRATIANRDNVFADDNVRITLDTFDDQRRAYIFFFNPFGIQADGIMTDGQGGPDLSVDIVMESKGVLLDDGYSVEVKIPFKSLRYAEGKGQSWGFNVGRRIPRLNDESDSWAPIIRNISSLRQIGKISGLDDIKSERNIEIVPSMTLSESAERVADASLPL
ncbi:MAG: carbohydrate binding family 9 domain-containing protein, partial [Pyrinomonadaceae bacterium]